MVIITESPCCVGSTVVLLIREIPSLDLDPDDDCTGFFFLIFREFLHLEQVILFQSRPRPLHYTSLRINCSPTIQYFDTF